ncbi:MAG: hypothetical protein HZB12_00565 [Candidatus Yonathbacteria bacterium]|nr:hypothetical protein [Candidatus Yonathbacteria bacterium]
METEEITPSGSKKFFKIVLGVFGVIVVLLTIAFILTKMKNAREAEVLTATPIVQKVYTQEDKLQILKDLASSTPKDTSTQQAEKLKVLKTLAKQAPKESASSTAEKLRILQELAGKQTQ